MKAGGKECQGWWRASGDGPPALRTQPGAAPEPRGEQPARGPESSPDALLSARQRPAPRAVAPARARPDLERRLAGSGLLRASAPGECAGLAGARSASGEAERGSPGQCPSSAGGPGSSAGLEPDSFPTLLWGERAALEFKNCPSPLSPLPLLPGGEVAGGGSDSGRSRCSRLGGRGPTQAQGRGVAVGVRDTPLRVPASGAPTLRSRWGGERPGTGQNPALEGQQSLRIHPPVG